MKTTTNSWVGRARRPLRAAIALAFGLVCAAASVTTALPSVERVRPPRLSAAAVLPTLPEPPAPAPADGGMDAASAILANQKVPFSREPVIAARPFVFGAASAPDRARALDCLTQAIYYEAGYEPTDGQRAVAQVVLNRVRHPAFPKSVCGVVFQGAPAAGCQFTFACDGSMGRAPQALAWARARAVAREALAGYVMPGVGEATHYHAQYVAPAWNGELAKIVQIGAHIFYRWNGAWGLPAQFAARYAEREPVISLKAAPAPANASLALAANLPPEEPHAPDDVGGRVDLSHGWTPSPPASPSSALDQVMARQGKAADGAPG